MAKLAIRDIRNIVHEALLKYQQILESHPHNKQLYKTKTLFEYIYNAVRNTNVGDKVILPIYNRADDATKSSIIRYMSVFCTLDICSGNIIDGYYKIGKSESEKMMPYEFAKKYLNSHNGTSSEFNVTSDVIRRAICTTSASKVKKAEAEIQKHK